MRIALDARVATEHFPGIGRACVQLAAALARAMEPGDLVLLADPRQQAGSGPLAGLPIVPCRASPFSLSQQWHVPLALRLARADLYHSLFYLMPWSPGAMTVWTCHDLIPLVLPQFFDPVRRTVYEQAHRIAARVARVILVPSASTKRDLVERLGIDPERITVIPWAADPRFTPAPEDAVEQMRARLGLAGEYFLFVGSNKPHKGLLNTVRAFARIVERWRGTGPGLVVAGPWDERYGEARLEAQQSGLGSRIRFLGPVDDADLPALYSSALAFVFPSEYEGFGFPVLEAMACGSPTITCNRSSLPEVAGDAAILVPPRDPEALAVAMERLAEDTPLRTDLRERGLRRSTLFSWDRVARETLDVYRHVVTP